MRARAASGSRAARVRRVEPARARRCRRGSADRAPRAQRPRPGRARPLVATRAPPHPVQLLQRGERGRVLGIERGERRARRHRRRARLEHARPGASNTASAASPAGQNASRAAASNSGGTKPSISQRPPTIPENPRSTPSRPVGVRDRPARRTSCRRPARTGPRRPGGRHAAPRRARRRRAPRSGAAAPRTGSGTAPAARRARAPDPRAASADEAPDLIQQQAQVERLLEVAVGERADARSSARLIAIGVHRAHQHHRDRRAGALDLAAHLEAVLARQLDVDEAPDPARRARTAPALRVPTRAAIVRSRWRRGSPTGSGGSPGHLRRRGSSSGRLPPSVATALVEAIRRDRRRPTAVAPRPGAGGHAPRRPGDPARRGRRRDVLARRARPAARRSRRRCRSGLRSSGGAPRPPRDPGRAASRSPHGGDQRLVEQRRDVGRDRAVDRPRARVRVHDLIGAALDAAARRRAGRRPRGRRARRGPAPARRPPATARPAAPSRAATARRRSRDRAPAARTRTAARRSTPRARARAGPARSRSAAERVGEPRVAAVHRLVEPVRRQVREQPAGQHVVPAAQVARVERRAPRDPIGARDERRRSRRPSPRARGSSGRAAAAISRATARSACHRRVERVQVAAQEAARASSGCSRENASASRVRERALERRRPARTRPPRSRRRARGSATGSSPRSPAAPASISVVAEVVQPIRIVDLGGEPAASSASALVAAAAAASPRSASPARRSARPAGRCRGLAERRAQPRHRVDRLTAGDRRARRVDRIASRGLQPRELRAASPQRGAHVGVVSRRRRRRAAPSRSRCPSGRRASPLASRDRRLRAGPRPSPPATGPNPWRRSLVGITPGWSAVRDELVLGVLLGERQRVHHVRELGLRVRRVPGPAAGQARGRRGGSDRACARSTPR